MNSINSCPAIRGVDGVMLRLGLTVGLGMLGVMLMPGRMNFFPNPIIIEHLWPMLIWLAMVLFAGALLRWVEGPGDDEVHRGRDGRGVAVHSAMAMIAPFYLMTAPDTVRRRWHSGVVFAVFPFLFIGSAVSWMGWRQVGLTWFALGLWTWLACSLLFWISPPRCVRHHMRVGDVIRGAAPGLAMAAAIILSAMLLLMVCYGVGFGMMAMAYFLGAAVLFLAMGWLLGPLLLMIDARTAVGRASGRSSQAGPMRVAMAGATAVGLYGVLWHRAVEHVFTGAAFSMKFYRENAGFSLDSPTVGKYIFWFTLFMVTMLVYVSLARALADRKRWTGYLAFAVPVVVLGLLNLAAMVDTFGGVIAYIHNFGVTPRRVMGLMYGGGCWGVWAVFFAWALLPERTQKIRQESVGEVRIQDSGDRMSEHGLPPHHRAPRPRHRNNLRCYSQ